MNIKTVFFEQLKPFFKNNGYRFVSGHAPKFLKITNDYVIDNGFNYFTVTNKIYGGKLALSINCIEDIILEVQYPNKLFSDFLEKKNDFLLTIGDRDGKIYFNGDIELDSEEKIINYTNAIKNYIETDGKSFIEKYSYLPNILTEMNRLESEGKYWSEILAGSADNLFRGLIIAKLCNDINFQKKLNYVDKIFYDDPDEWIPYYEKLKERLKSVEPIYNI